MAAMRLLFLVVLVVVSISATLATQPSKVAKDPHVYNVPLNIPQGPNTIFQETFDDDSWLDRWVVSEHPDYTGACGLFFAC